MADVIRLNHKVLGIDELDKRGRSVREGLRALVVRVARWDARAVRMEHQLDAVKQVGESRFDFGAF
jgi:hypothetical protein